MASLGITAGGEGSQTWLCRIGIKRMGAGAARALFLSNGGENVMFGMFGLWGDGHPLWLLRSDPSGQSIMTMISVFFLMETSD